MKSGKIRYPVYTENSAFDSMALKVGYLPFKCIVCNEISIIKILSKNLRETCICRSCKSANRARQLSYVLVTTVLQKSPLFSSLKSFVSRDDLSLYYTESKGPMHNSLHKMKNFVCSEYFGEEYKSGSLVNGILHQDLQSLSFPDNSFDVVVSSEVFEHIPNSYLAFQEVHRVLKPGGRHIFTIPFDARGFTDIVKAFVDEQGNVQYLAEPEYHEDPIRPEGGILVYRIFSLEMLVRLNTLGFVTNMHHLYNPLLGIFGNNAIVFESIKIA